MANRIYLAPLDTTKFLDGKELLKDVDNILNVVTGHFKKFAKHKNVFYKLQLELNDTWKILKHCQKICWLLKWQAISTLCDLLESMLTYYKDTLAGKDVKLDGMACWEKKY